MGVVERAQCGFGLQEREDGVVSGVGGVRRGGLGQEEVDRLKDGSLGGGGDRGEGEEGKELQDEG